MAVYTEVGDTELEAFLAEYDIGQADSFKGIAEGVENTNFLLTTTKGQYIVTLYSATGYVLKNGTGPTLPDAIAAALEERP